MRQRTKVLVGIVLLSLPLAGCHRRAASDAAVRACGPVDALLPAGADPRHLSGSYDVTFAATGGPRAGQQVQGRLVLRPQDAALVRVPSADSVTRIDQPSIGTLEVEPDSIGATRMGDLMAADPGQPGVGVYVATRPGGEVTGIVARIGSLSNARPTPGMVAFDGGHFSLHVKRVDENGFWGDWLSSPGPGGMMTAEARGHFCAIKSRS